MWWQPVQHPESFAICLYHSLICLTELSHWYAMSHKHISKSRSSVWWTRTHDKLWPSLLMLESVSLGEIRFIWFSGIKNSRPQLLNLVSWSYLKVLWSWTKVVAMLACWFVFFFSFSLLMSGCSISWTLPSIPDIISSACSNLLFSTVFNSWGFHFQHVVAPLDSCIWTLSHQEVALLKKD